MKLKSLLFGATVTTLLIANPLFAAHAGKATSAELGTLATIAAIDKNEILVSVVATNKKDAGDVADFAKMMIDQHGDNLTQILQLAHNYHDTSLRGGEAEKLAAEGKKEMIKLGALDDDQFEIAYANAMVSGHEAALKLIDDKLMKTAKTEDIKKFLTDTRAVVAQHLEHAKKLQADLKA